MNLSILQLLGGSAGGLDPWNEKSKKSGNPDLSLSKQYHLAN